MLFNCVSEAAADAIAWSGFVVAAAAPMLDAVVLRLLLLRLFPLLLVKLPRPFKELPPIILPFPPLLLIN